MMTLESLLKEGQKTLMQHNMEEARLDAWLLLEYVTGKNRAYYFAHSDDPVENANAVRYQELIEKRAGHIPLQHLTHEAYFMGYPFYVDEHVLVPRQDTEVLVEEALEVLKGTQAPQILDMCTGSGCIVLSMLAMREDAAGTGVDVSPEALAVAKRNALALEVEKRVEFIESDIFSSVFFQEKAGKDQLQYDILISNPPYIPSADIEDLMEEVKDHDPRIALDGHEDGLFFYRKIIQEGRNFLKKKGWMLFEIGYDQGNDVSELLRNSGFTDVQVRKDMAGLDRVVLGQKD